MKAELAAHLERGNRGGHRLFAYPAQSNFSGVQHPLDWIPLAQERGWDVLLDAAAFTPTNRLDLGRWRPDFVSQSFYKMFGYPTGVGCLIARKAALAKLRRPWFAGGTITVASVQGDRFYLAEGASAFEDGTPNYLALPAVEFGLQYLSQIGIDTIHTRVRCLTGWLIERLTSLRHSGGEPLARIYGPRSDIRRGGTVTFNFYDAAGRAIDHRDVEERANAAGISLRTGCFCNPGGGEIALGITGTELSSCFHQPEHETHLTIDDFRSLHRRQEHGGGTRLAGTCVQSRRRRGVRRIRSDIRQVALGGIFPTTRITSPWQRCCSHTLHERQFAPHRVACAAPARAFAKRARERHRHGCAARAGSRRAGVDRGQPACVTGAVRANARCT